MHNSLSFLTLFFMVPMLALAQTPQSQKELREDRMQALRVAFFVEELSLTPEESALFSLFCGGSHSPQTQLLPTGHESSLAWATVPQRPQKTRAHRRQ